VDRGWSTRLAAVLGWGPVASLRSVLARYDAAGGGLLAGGLAYMALFALVPLTLLVAGILGLVVADTAERASVVDTIANVLPPLRGIVRLVLDEAADAAGAISLVGGVALVWGASRFVVAFEGAMGRIFGGVRHRGFVVRNAAAILAVICLIGAAVLGATLTGMSSFLDAAQAAGVPVMRFMNAVGFALVPLLAAALSITLVYRFVPVLAPGWRALLPPAVVVAITLDILARAFMFLAPRLIGAAATIGALASAFVALAWLSLSFQAILLGAAWVRQRDAEWGMQEEAPSEPAA
jgi:membrane protein